MFVSLQQQLLQSMEPALTFSQATKSCETLDLLLLPGLIAGSRVDNDAVCASIINLLYILGRKLLYDSQIKMMQEQLFFTAAMEYCRWFMAVTDAKQVPRLKSFDYF